MANVLYVEPFGGLAGDMFLAALCDLDDPRFGVDDLRRLASALVPGECTIEASETRRGGLRALRLDVRTAESDHPPHRTLPDLLALVDGAPLGEVARERAARVFRRLAEAEARAHGIEVERVHFHEVGAVDTLVDVCGVVLALERLEVGRVLSSPPRVGSGTVTCAHGEMPVPAPGTAALLEGVPVLHGGDGERLTPTGAALLVTLASFESPGALTTLAVGYGAGARETTSGPPNLARVQLARAASAVDPSQEVVELFELQVDDSTGEELGFALERLRATGALDVWVTPVQMKKGRPGVLVSGLVPPGSRAEIEQVAFRDTSTLGVRWSSRERTVCAREEWTVELDGELAGRTVRIKRRRAPGASDELRAADLAPEYEDLATLARETGLPVRELAGRAVRAALETRR